MNLDQLNMVPAHPTIQVAYAALSGAQDAPKAAQVMAFAFLFHATCSRLGLDPGEMLDKARRLTRTAQDHYSVELRAFNDYVKQELGA